MSSDPTLVKLAVRLQELGVSGTRIVELLSKYPPEEIERQLDWLPYRKAKRPEAFVIDAIRNNYSAPKEIYAQLSTEPARPPGAVDQGSELPA